MVEVPPLRRIVTTATRPDPALEARARRVAERCGLPYVRRTGSLSRTVGDADAAYVVRRDRDELWSPTERIHVNAGLTLARLHDGVDHPLIRALAPSGRAARICDATLGLCLDALHVAGALDAAVVGCELAPEVYSLCEEGLARLARDGGPVGAAAERIEPRLGESSALMAAEPDDSFDAVLVSPMFEAPRHAPPGYQSFRDAAVHGPLSEATLREALRLAPRVVVKLEPWAEAPGSLRPYPHDVVRGKALAYWVITRPSR